MLASYFLIKHDLFYSHDSWAEQIITLFSKQRSVLNIPAFGMLS
jgi:hypothetical protein